MPLIQPSIYCLVKHGFAFPHILYLPSHPFYFPDRPSCTASRVLQGTFTIDTASMLLLLASITFSKLEMAAPEVDIPVAVADPQSLSFLPEVDKALPLILHLVTTLTTWLLHSNPPGCGHIHCYSFHETLPFNWLLLTQ